MSYPNNNIFDKIITKSSKMLEIFQYIESIAKTGKPVLITGETGVGKELIVEAIHGASGLTGRFLMVNAAGLDDNMFSDTLFGHYKGAYTGADSEKKGLLERAEGGTLVLDEIGDLSLTSQVKLLRLVQYGEYMPLGSNSSRIANVRILAVTNKDLWKLQRSGAFREDLNFRLRSHHINVPPLRERLEDIPLLFDFFLDKAAQALHKPLPSVPKELIALLKTFPFPGNVREFQDMVFDAVSRQSDDKLSIEVFRSYFRRPQRDKFSEHDALNPDQGNKVVFSLELPTIKEVTSLLIVEALKRANNNQTTAAKLLGISQQALNKRLTQKNSKSSGL
ncbi:MAG: hypothetical protein A2511_16845 [Deltaproteobacteria bacterium RIFOXYD12_FULL_50_9]|nr:MAG: hypothetical protein A2511_16845 [Deltaproteobacteria bacterium RIFOXYD12_FULL_50_9]